MANIDSNMEKQPLLSNSPPQQQQQQQPDQEPSLAELQQDVFRAQRRYMRAWSRTTSGKWHKRIMIAVTLLFLLFIGFCFGVIILDSLEDENRPYTRTRVPLEAHIMSKCPDARDCLHDMILPAMQNISHLVDFRLSYIGRQTDSEDGVECKHGQEECLGNIIELCAARDYPVKQSLGFTMCLSRDYEDIPQQALVEDCALEHGITVSSLNECVTSGEGDVSVAMLQSSFRRSSAAGVTKSCTVRVDEEIWCVRDGGEWKECDGHDSTAEALVSEIRGRYERLWMEYE